MYSIKSILFLLSKQKIYKARKKADIIRLMTQMILVRIIMRWFLSSSCWTNVCVSYELLTVSFYLCQFTFWCKYIKNTFMSYVRQCMIYLEIIRDDGGHYELDWYIIGNLGRKFCIFACTLGWVKKRFRNCNIVQN